MQSVGQSFVIGRSGIVTGIEFGLGTCGLVDPNVRIVVTVTRSGTAIATTSIPATQVSACGSLSLSSNTVGQGFFDLSSQCPSVTAGDSLVAILTLTGVTGTCGPGTCLGGPNAGNMCMSDSDCQYTGEVGAHSGGYANGSLLGNGFPEGAEESPFKVFVR
jgi:hypothetical protein